MYEDKNDLFTNCFLGPDCANKVKIKINTMNNSSINFGITKNCPQSTTTPSDEENTLNIIPSKKNAKQTKRRNRKKNIGSTLINILFPGMNIKRKVK